jgi:moderate conductance mechanosensitive channel
MTCRRDTFSFLLALFVLALLAPLPASGQTAPAPAPPAGATQLTPEQARQALDVLNDPKQRAAIAATLEAIAKAGPAPAGVTAPARPPSNSPQASPPAAGTGVSTPLGLQLAPDSLGAAVLVSASNITAELADRAEDVLHAARGVPLLWHWVVTMVTDPDGRRLLADVAWRLAVTLALSFAVLFGAVRLLRPALRGVAWRLAHGHLAVAPEFNETGEARAERGEVEPAQRRRFDVHKVLSRVPLVLARLSIELAPILAFLIVGHIVAGSELGGTELTRLVLLAVVDSVVVCSAALRLARAVLAPRHRRLRLIPVPDMTARYAVRWIRRIVVVGVVGYAIAEVGLLLGLSRMAHMAVLKSVLLLVDILVATIVFQKRHVVRGWIMAPRDATGAMARLRNSLAATWHWFALIYLAISWAAWAIPVPEGYQQVLRGLLSIVAVYLAARLAISLIVNALDRAMAGAGNTTLSQRLAFYHPFAVALIRVAVYVVALLVYLEMVGIASFEWLTGNPLGTRISQAMTSLAITIAVALGVWEVATSAIERHLGRLTSTAQVARAARLRTLLPILRAALLVAVLTVTGLMVLSQIGVNTAPLLASAGIIGVAIGFGSQKLVQDLITGLFLLLENAMQVGDWVTVAGLSGTVEHLSVRTIRLRAADGSVHIIPFSAVTSVSNTNRGLGNAAVSVTVAFHEDTDRVCEVLGDIARAIRAEPAFAAGILGELQIFGVDRMDGASATVTGQIPCTDSGRWGVQREFNRRMKLRFEAEGIALFDPTRTYLVPLNGEALPAVAGPALAHPTPGAVPAAE